MATGVRFNEDVSDGPRGNGEQILIAEDDPMVRLVAARILAKEGYGIWEASDGLEALEFLRDGAVLIHLLLSDVVMPRLNGVELASALSLSHPDLPIILMSGYAARELVSRGIVVPCSILGKPFDPEYLVAEVRRCLKSTS
jgi:two-component system cell cycle sensor histidine kinase/response regulator CckA